MNKFFFIFVVAIACCVQLLLLIFVTTNPYFVRLFTIKDFSELPVVKKVAVASVSIRTKRETWDQVIENHEKYASKHNYDYFLLTDYLNHSCNAKWQKPFLIYNLFFNQSFLKTAAVENKVKTTFVNSNDTKIEFEYVLWIDVDAIFMNLSVTVESIFDYATKMCNNSASLIITGDKNAILNNGIFIFKKSEFTKQFLEKWMNAPKADIKKMSDQPRMVAILLGAESSDNETIWKSKFELTWGTQTISRNQSQYAQSHILDPKVKQHVCIVEQNVMNSYTDFYKQGDFILHLAGMSNKLQIITKYLLFNKNISIIKNETIAE